MKKIPVQKNLLPAGAKEIAVRLARQAGRLLKARFGKRKSGRLKGKRHLQIPEDRLVDNLLFRALRKAFPEHGLYTEETGRDSLQSPYCWIVDPLDGTHNYAWGIPWYAVSIALAKNGVAVLGVIYQPEYGRLIVAEKGKGAFANGKRIRVSTQSDMSRSCLAFDSGLTKSSRHLKHLPDLADATFLVRMSGSTVTNLAMVALRQAEIFVDFNSQPWDHSAGALIVEEAGGRVTGEHNEPWRPDSHFILATNGLVHEAALRTIRKFKSK